MYIRKCLKTGSPPRKTPGFYVVLAKRNAPQDLNNRGHMVPPGFVLRPRIEYLYRVQLCIYSSLFRNGSVNLISFPESSFTRKSRFPQGLRMIPWETRAPRS